MSEEVTQSNIQKLVDDAKTEVRKELISKFTKYFVAGLIGIGTLAVIGGWTLFLPWLKTQTGGAPSGAIVAVEQTNEECPAGWEPFYEGRGRVIVGAGDPSKASRKLGFDADGNPLTEYAYRQHGGVESVTLNVQQIPAHSHQTTIMVGDQLVDGVDSVTTHSGDHHNQSKPTALTGAGEPHENRPPFIALYHCKKK